MSGHATGTTFAAQTRTHPEGAPPQGAPRHFASFFQALWGNAPFAWQDALAKRVLGGAFPANHAPADHWPDAIALPTASGKTACMDIALFALASQAARLRSGQAITAPRRIFFVVDRRVIVDEAHERACRLAAELAKAKEGVLKAVADDLRRVAHGACTGFEDERPLAIHALRGGVYRSEAWAHNPLQPTIVASTVDQIGSRLLFRAYGRGPGTWPIYAGLVANDSLVLLDEAHCAQPFLQTLRAVGSYRSWAQKPLGRRFHPVVMSATPPPDCNDVFKDTSGEGRDPRHPLGRRQLAEKPATLRRVTKATGDGAVAALSKALVESARGLLGDGREAIVVFANRVATARETHRRLLEKDDVEAILLTGRMRQVDKDVVGQRLRDLDLHSHRAACRRLAKPVIVVATQTLEVGADLDFDGLATECASLDALRQRFGRLNRMGRDVEARAVVLVRADQTKGKTEKDPVYGEALARTWSWLDDSKSEGGEVNFGIAHLDLLLGKTDSLADLNAPAPDAPVMLPAHVDCWAQTAPVPQPSPDVSHFLHGPRESVPDVQVCWRADLDLASTAAQIDAIDSLTLCPPASSEMLPVRIGLFRRWLAGKATDSDADADIEGTANPLGDSVDGVDGAGSTGGDRRVIRWRGAATEPKHVTFDPADIEPGDVIVVPTAHPGPHDQLGDLPPEASDNPATLDVGDVAHRMARAKPILRLSPALVDAWPEPVAGKATARALLDQLSQKYEEDPHAVAEEVRGLLTELSQAETPDRWAWLPEAAKELLNEFRTVAALRQACRLVGDESLILAGRRRIEKLAQSPASAPGSEASRYMPPRPSTRSR